MGNVVCSLKVKPVVVYEDFNMELANLVRDARDYADAVSSAVEIMISGFGDGEYARNLLAHLQCEFAEVEGGLKVLEAVLEEAGDHQPAPQD